MDTLTRLLAASKGPNVARVAARVQTSFDNWRRQSEQAARDIECIERDIIADAESRGCRVTIVHDSICIEQPGGKK